MSCRNGPISNMVKVLTGMDFIELGLRMLCCLVPMHGQGHKIALADEHWSDVFETVVCKQEYEELVSDLSLKCLSGVAPNMIGDGRGVAKAMLPIGVEVYLLNVDASNRAVARFAYP